MNQPLPRARMTAEETRTTLASFVWQVCLRSVYDTLCCRTTLVFTAFALALGLARENMAWLDTAGRVACVAQLAGAFLANVVTDKRRFVLRAALVEPLLLVGAVVAIGFMPPSLRLWGLAAAVLLSAGSLQLYVPLMDNWFASTIPPSLRGRYLAVRHQALNAVTIIALVASGFAVERIGQGNAAGLGGLVVLGGLFGVGAVLMLWRAAMPPISASARVSWADLAAVWRERPFRNYVLAIVLFNIPFMLACSYYSVFNLTVLHMKPSHIALMAAGYSVAKMLSAPMMGQLVDRRGPRWTVGAFTILYVACFSSYTVAFPGRWWPVAVGTALSGIADCGYGIATAAACFSTIPMAAARPAYFALSSLVPSAVFAVGSGLAAPLLHALHRVASSAGLPAEAHFRLFFGLVSAMMVVCGFSVLLLPGRRGTRPISTGVNA